MCPHPRYIIIQEGRGLHIDVHGEIHRYEECRQPSVEPGRAADTEGASYEGRDFGEVLMDKNLHCVGETELRDGTRFCKMGLSAV